MNLLSKTEELILLTVWRLQDRAYSVEIRNELKRISGKSWSFGAVYMPLDRMVKTDLLVSRLTEPTPHRGGRSKRIYSLTVGGLNALRHAQAVNERAWQGIPDSIPESTGQ